MPQIAIRSVEGEDLLAAHRILNYYGTEASLPPRTPDQTKEQQLLDFVAEDATFWVLYEDDLPMAGAFNTEMT